MKPAVSVIIPVWNAESYLRRCLDSLLAQTLANIEILCADDASTDNSLAMLHQYAAHDARVRVVPLPAKAGIAVARNAALALARGEYMGFVDSDDAVDPDFYEKLYTTAKASGADMVKGNVMEHNVHGTTREANINPGVRVNALIFWSQWCSAIYSTDMLQKHGICFPEDLIMGEDSVFLVQSLLHAKVVITIDDTFYHQYIRAESMSHAFNEDRCISWIRAYERVLHMLHDQFVAHKDKEDYQSIFFEYFMGILHIGTYLQEVHNIRHMAEIFCDLYAACPFTAYVDAHLPLAALRPLLHNNDVAGVAALVAKIMPKELQVARLRSRIRRRWQGRAVAEKSPAGPPSLEHNEYDSADSSPCAGTS